MAKRKPLTAAPAKAKDEARPTITWYDDHKGEPAPKPKPATITPAAAEED
jgi:hypothetical protein